MDKKSRPYLIGRFFDGISSGLFMMALPWIMLQTPNMGTFVALVALSCTLVSFALTPYFSAIIDRYSRKRVLLINQCIQASVAFTVVFCSLLNWDSVWLLATAQLLFWVSSNVGWNANNAFTQENYSKNQYANISGQQEVVMQATTLGSGALGILLLAQWGMLEFALFAALASSLSALAYALTPYRRKLRTPQQQPTFGGNWQQLKTELRFRRRFYTVVFLSALTYPMLTYLSKLVPIWFTEQHIEGYWFAAYNLCFGMGSLITGIVVSRILNRWQAPKLIQFALYTITGLLFAMSVSSPLPLVLLTIGFGFFNALNRISRTNWMHHEVDMRLRGRIDGAISMFSTLCQSLGYVVIALLTHAQITVWGFYLAAISMLLVALCIQRLNRPEVCTERVLG